MPKVAIAQNIYILCYTFIMYSIFFVLALSFQFASGLECFNCWQLNCGGNRTDIERCGHDQVSCLMIKTPDGYVIRQRCALESIVGCKVIEEVVGAEIVRKYECYCQTDLCNKPNYNARTENRHTHMEEQDNKLVAKEDNEFGDAKARSLNVQDSKNYASRKEAQISLWMGTITLIIFIQ